MNKILLVLILFSSCNRFNAEKLDPQQIKETTALINRFEKNILQAEENARNTFSTFLRQLNRANSDKGDFYVKYPVLADAGKEIRTEQIWLTGIYYENGNYYGMLANTPLNISSLKKGDRIIFYTDSISDWMYISNGKIIGGQSIKYLLEKIPESDRSFQQKKILGMFN